MHTPGPTIHDTEWRAMLMGSEGWSVFAGHRMIASNLSEANARLIAAAPELLEALQTIATIRRKDHFYDPDDMLGVLKIADNAIARATKGETNEST